MTPEDVAWLTSPDGQTLLRRWADLAPDAELAAATRMRAEGHSPEQAGLVLTQTRLRQRAVARFGPAGRRRIWTAEGLEQASRPEVAHHRARRFGRLGARRIADLCCGVGGDLLALAEAATHVAGPGEDIATVTGVELDPGTAAAARANVRHLGDRVRVVTADATSLDPAEQGWDAVFVDPSRRSGGRRRFDLDGYSPPYAFVGALSEQVDAVAAKLAPGVPHDRLDPSAETEWVSWAGDVKEACVWFGPLATPGVRRRATLLPGGETVTDLLPSHAVAGPVADYLVEPDGAVVRAGLVAAVAAEVSGRLLDPRIAYVTCADVPTTRLGRGYRVLETLPFAVKALRSALRSLGFGDVVVKKRGVAVVPEDLRRSLRLTGDGPTATLVLTRVGDRPLCLLVEPLVRPA